MRVRFWGVRGAFAATTPESLGIGGNTPCVEVRDSNGYLLILDAGIGLYWLGRNLLTGPCGRGQGELTMLLSHSHWDHIQGFPFFVPGFIPGNKVDIWGGGVTFLEDILEGQMSPTYSPIASMSNMGSSLTVGDLAEHPELTPGGFSIRHATFRSGPHDVVGYRISEGNRSLCYIAEVEHGSDGTLCPEVVELAKGADVLIHEAYYTNEEFAGHRPRLAGDSGPRSNGHCSFEQATDVALAAGVKRLQYFYHHPDHDDETIHAAVDRERERVAAMGVEMRIESAREGLEFEV
jgi:phosphoribosyl 1,2-cyclic phosphodiesterase